MTTFTTLLLAYLPLLAAAAALYFFVYRKRLTKNKLKEQITEYNLTESTMPRKERFLEDDAPPGEYDDIIERLFYMFETKKLYLDPNIRISDIAEKLFTNKTYLSKAIKTKTNKNFCQLIHYYRVKEAVALFSANPELSITELRKLVGFNSMTTFNSAFGRNTGYTPAEWCKDFRRKNKMEDKYVCEDNE